jgi:two-component system OmpR family response regulator
MRGFISAAGGGYACHMRILLIEDDAEAAAYLVKALREAGHVPDHAADGQTGATMAAAGKYDVLVVDRMLPQRDGLAVIEGLRAGGDQTPALILSALGQVDDRVAGLRAGGDDYLPKPYAFSELLARVEVLARRRNPSATETSYRVGDLELDRLGHTASRAGQSILLQRREFRLLEFLMQHPGQAQVWSVDEIDYPLVGFRPERCGFVFNDAEVACGFKAVFDGSLI